MCNPIGQAVFLNKAGTQLNVILGLCVGHDSLFIKHAEAPVTVFAVKDRVLAHNPWVPFTWPTGIIKTSSPAEENGRK